MHTPPLLFVHTSPFVLYTPSRLFVHASPFVCTHPPVCLCTPPRWRRREYRGLHWGSPAGGAHCCWCALPILPCSTADGPAGAAHTRATLPCHVGACARCALCTCCWRSVAHLPCSTTRLWRPLQPRLWRGGRLATKSSGASRQGERGQLRWLCMAALAVHGHWLLLAARVDAQLCLDLRPLACVHQRLPSPPCLSPSVRPRSALARRWRGATAAARSQKKTSCTASTPFPTTTGALAGARCVVHAVPHVARAAPTSPEGAAMGCCNGVLQCCCCAPLPQALTMSHSSHAPPLQLPALQP